MCQLTLVNLGNSNFNRYYLYAQLWVNVETTHRDGCGVFQPGNKVFKTKLHPQTITNLGELLNIYVKNNSPVIGHVRLASWNQKNISDENAHPFETENLILSHNGTLEFKDLERLDDPRFKGKIDSEIFAILLEEEYKKTKNMVESLNTVYSLFYGKFAFIIYSKPENKIYIARGVTAKLFKKDFFITNGEGVNEFVGYVINTEEFSLTKAAVLAQNFFQLSLKTSITFSKEIELEENSIFTVNPDKTISLVGKITQTYKPAAVVIYSAGQPVSTHPVTSYSNNQLQIENKADKLRKEEFIGPIIDFMFANDLDLEEVDELFFHTVGAKFIECNRQDLINFVNYIIPVLDEEAKKYKNIKKAWSMLLLAEPSLSKSQIIEQYGLQFPYFLNQLRDLRDTIKDLKEGKLLNESIQ